MSVQAAQPDTGSKWTYISWAEQALALGAATWWWWWEGVLQIWWRGCEGRIVRVGDLGLGAERAGCMVQRRGTAAKFQGR